MTHAATHRQASIFLRTENGRRALFDVGAELTEPQRRLLLMVNGETPLAALAELSPNVDQAEVIEPLLDEGLIAPAEGLAFLPARPHAWKVPAAIGR